MNKLIMDTSTKYLYVCLIKNNEKQEIIKLGNNDHSKTLIPTIEELLNENNLTINDISTIITGKGPGSYTGIRIAITVAKCLAYKKDIKVKEISSLKLLASKKTEKHIASLIKARRNDCFCALYTLEDNILKEDIKEKFSCIDEFRDEVNFLTDALIYEEFKDIDVDIVLKNSKEINIFELKPNYLRITEAERLKNGDK